MRRKTRSSCPTSPPPEFDLVSLEVGLVLHHFNKTLQTHAVFRNKASTFGIIETSATFVRHAAASTVAGLSVSRVTLDPANISKPIQ